MRLGSGSPTARRARLTTKRASVVVTVAVDDAMAAGHLALPNGLGVDHLGG